METESNIRALQQQQQQQRPQPQAAFSEAMATLARLQARSKILNHHYYYKNSVVDEFRKKENDAAVVIQSWFRGCRVRAYIRYLHKMVTTIQKWWRGYLGRRAYRVKVKKACYTMKMDLYNAMAVRIQRRWRGYKIRKYCFNYYYLKEYLRAVSETNEAIREALAEFAEMKEREEKKARLEQEEKRQAYLARKMHYLLSTSQIPGVYNSPFRSKPHPWELRLQKAKPLSHPLRQEPPKMALNDWLACTSTRSFPRSDILPPIDRKKCQGPFRNIAEVLEQRYKPLQPSVQRTDPLEDLKEAREEFRRLEKSRNVQDQAFLPFSNYHKNEKYLPMIHTSSKYGPDSFQCQRFRDETPDKWICRKDFQTVLPSFELFSNFGKLYSRAGSII